MNILYIESQYPHMLYVNESFAEQFQVRPQRLLLQLGSWRREVRVIVKKDLPENTIGLSAQLKKSFTLPSSLDYDIRVEGRTVHIGPVIAFVAFVQASEITPEILKKVYLDYFRGYQDIKGLVYLCAQDSIHPSSKTISGLFYRPSANGGGFHKGTFPYPEAVYRRVPIEPKVLNDLVQHTGDKIFNSYFSEDHFDKWEMWRWLSSHAKLREHLPYTTLLTGLPSVQESFSRFETLYLKPRINNMSKGIIKAVKEGDDYLFFLQVRDKSARPYTLKRMDSSAAAEFLNKLARKGYIVQKGLQAPLHEERTMDFRIILQKNSSKRWECNGVFARFGKKKSFVSNFTLAGYAMHGEAAIKTVLRMDEAAVKQKVKELVEISTLACEVLEAAGGHYADTGVDAMIDDSGKIWIMEINVLPFHDFPLHAKADDVYRRVVAAPLSYAKTLTVFGGNRA
ncbi:MAG: hypothetical protein K0R57_6149 [Paenibacillaceae bacterium]|jgi:hypothetical protein|nr:hypothetical protein [Paenibacillaceae bacterium]